MSTITTISSLELALRIAAELTFMAWIAILLVHHWRVSRRFKAAINSGQGALQVFVAELAKANVNNATLEHIRSCGCSKCKSTIEAIEATSKEFLSHLIVDERCSSQGFMVIDASKTLKSGSVVLSTKESFGSAAEAVEWCRSQGQSAAYVIMSDIGEWNPERDAGNDSAIDFRVEMLS